jgi:hypothetical protein
MTTQKVDDYAGVGGMVDPFRRGSACPDALEQYVRKLYTEVAR